MSNRRFFFIHVYIQYWKIVSSLTNFPKFGWILCIVIIALYLVKNGGITFINHTKNTLNYTLKFVVKSLLTAVTLSLKDKMILADDPPFKLKIRYFYLKRIHSLLYLKRIYSMTVCLVMSRTRFRVSPHSIVAWMSRNLVECSFTN